jgi:hypothetical protein
MTAIDRWMPVYDVTATYCTRVEAPVERVFEAVLDADVGGHPLVALLMGLRMIPGVLLEPLKTLRRLRRAEGAGRRTLRGQVSDRFVLLETLAPTETVFGLTGRFWTATGGLLSTDPATFRQLPPAGTARAAWNFLLTPLSDRDCILATETRMRCSDPATLRQFRRYWAVVAPGSGLIRRVMLRRIRRKAEAG